MSNDKEKVCVYARVSTDLIEQDASFNSQISFFKDKYKDRFEIVKVYAERQSGLNINKREQFREMLYDCGLDLEEKKGNINIYCSNRKSKYKYILTKSISRFSRNIEIVCIIRKLREKNVYVIFDDINKSTENEEDNLLLGILQQLAEEESRNKSKIVKWGKKRSAEQNIITMGTGLYGYNLDLQNNALIPIEEEAEVVKLIFNLALEDKGARIIKRLLTEKGIKNRNGSFFSEHGILYILKNPKYAGLNVRNRYSRIDIFNPRRQIQLPNDEWLVMENDRIEPIITKEEFEKVQRMIKNRTTATKGVHLSQHDLARKFRCGVCKEGYYIKAKETYRTTGNVRHFYNCNRKKKLGKEVCDNRNLDKKVVDELIEEWCNGKYHDYATKKIYNMAEILIKRLETIESDRDEDKEKLAKELNDKLNDNKIKIEKMLDIMLESDTSATIIKSKIEKFEDENKTLESKLRELSSTKERKEEVSENIKFFLGFLKVKFLDNLKNKYTREEFLTDILIEFTVTKNKFIINTKLDEIIAPFESIVGWNKDRVQQIIKNKNLNEEQLEYINKVFKVNSMLKL